VTTLSFHVSGMRSRRCVRAVSARVSDVAGVRTVEVDLGAGTVRVTGTAEPAAVRLAISRAGYDVVTVPADPATDGAVSEPTSARHRMEEGETWTAP
jgi:copper chaperone CopZ